MKRKVVLSLLILIISLLAISLLTSCGECEHEWGEWKITTPATCLHQGEKTRQCAKCEEKETQVIASYGHSYERNHDDMYHWEECKYCKNIENEHTHNFGNIYVIVEADCTTSGKGKYICEDCGYEFLVDISAKKHNYEIKHNETAHWKECSSCGDVIDENEHKFGEIKIVEDATCLNSGNGKYVCEDCGYEYIVNIPAKIHNFEQKHDEIYHWEECANCHSIQNKVSHNFGEMITIVEADCLKPGRGKYVCADCEYEYVIEIYQKTHNYEIKYNETYHWKECSRCGDIIDKVKHYYDNDGQCVDCEHKVKIEKVNGLKFSANKTTGTASVLRNETETLNENLTIPSKCIIEGKVYLVTSVGFAGFENCKSLTSVVLPNSITKIDSYAFSSCDNLTSVTISNNVTSVGFAGFENCKSLTSVVLPNSITKIDSYAFSSCDNLTSVTISNNVTSIENDAFASCKNLTSIDLPDSLIAIGESAFSHTGLTSIDLPDSLITIGESAFSHTGLTSIVIPDQVRIIKPSTFSGCNELMKVTIGRAVESIEGVAFYDCYKLIEIYNLSSLNITLDPNENGAIGRYAKVVYTSLDAESELVRDDKGYVTHFDEDTNKRTLMRYEGDETDLILPDNIQIVYKAAFRECENITSVVIPDSVIRIEQEAFYRCINLENVEFGNFIREIDSSAFNNCSSLTSLRIPSSVWLIGSLTFAGCSSLTNIEVEAENEYYKSDNNCLIKLNTNSIELACNNAVIPDYVETISRYSFVNYNGELIIPNNIIKIEEGAFSHCVGLTSVVIPNSLTEIAGFAFYNCEDLRNVKLSNSITRIKEYTFYYCRSLASINIPDSVEIIERGAFSHCVGLTSLFIPKNLTNIEVAFNECTKLESIEVSKENTVYKSENNCIIEIATNKLILGCKNSVIPNYVVEIDDAFFGCESLTSIIIPDAVQYIKLGSFYYCDNLESVLIGSGVTYIEEAFYDCYNLKYVYYKGTAEDWNQINIVDKLGNSPLNEARRYYYSEMQPLEDGYYWHYAADGVTPVQW